MLRTAAFIEQFGDWLGVALRDRRARGPAPCGATHRGGGIAGIGRLGIVATDPAGMRARSLVRSRERSHADSRWTDRGRGTCGARIPLWLS
jgi:hypothetical protein